MFAQTTPKYTLTANANMHTHHITPSTHTFAFTAEYIETTKLVRWAINFEPLRLCTRWVLKGTHRDDARALVSHHFARPKPFYGNFTQCTNKLLGLYEKLPRCESAATWMNKTLWIRPLLGLNACAEQWGLIRCAEISFDKWHTLCSFNCRERMQVSASKIKTLAPPVVNTKN